MYLLPLLYCIGHVSDGNSMIATWTASNYKLSSWGAYTASYVLREMKV